MAAKQLAGLFGRVPDEWFEPVVCLSVVVLSVAGMVLTLEAAGTLPVPLGDPSVESLLVTTLASAVAYGVFGLGTAYVYLERRGIDPGFVVEPLDRTEWRWVGGLGVLAVPLVALSAVWSGFHGRSAEVVTPNFMVESVPFPDGWYRLALAVTEVSELGTLVPVVALHASLFCVLIGPPVGALFHGVVQNTLIRVAPPSVVCGGTALTTALAVSSFAAPGVTAVRGFTTALAVFGFALAVAYGYRETGNLLVPMAAYGLFAALAVANGWLAVFGLVYPLL